MFNDYTWTRPSGPRSCWPLLDSDIVMDAFELAYAARALDMRASPYDMRGLGYQPVRIETPSGRADTCARAI